MTSLPANAADPISRAIWDMKYRLKIRWRRAARANRRGHLATRGAGPGRGRGAGPARPLGGGVPEGHGGSPIPARRPHPRRRRHRPRVTLFNCFVMGTIPDDMAGIFENLQGSGADHAAGRRHRLRLLDAPPQGRAGEGRRRRRLRPARFMDVWDAMCRTIMSAGLAPRRHDGDAALRPSRHRGLHRRQARPGAAAHVQPLGAGDRRLHDGGARTTPTGPLVFGGKVYRTVPRARSVGPHHARDLRRTPSRA